jgi:hypothetical protein
MHLTLPASSESQAIEARVSRTRCLNGFDVAGRGFFSRLLRGLMPLGSSRGRAMLPG